jgi:hypothetical protein
LRQSTRRLTFLGSITNVEQHVLHSGGASAGGHPHNV